MRRLPIKLGALVCVVAVTTVTTPGLGHADQAPGCRQPEDPADGTLVVVELSTSENLEGVYAGCKGAAILFNHPLLGLLVIPRQDVVLSIPPPRNVATVGAATILTATEAAMEADDVETDADVFTDEEIAAKADADGEKADSSPWKAKAQVGINGSRGNTDTLNARMGFDSKYATEDKEISATLNFYLDMDKGKIDDNTADTSLRYDLLFPDSPWRFYVANWWEYSNEEQWDFRTAGNTGPAYVFITNDLTTFLVRTGFGVSREFGGEDTTVHPEWLIGYDWDQVLSKSWSLAWESIYFQKLDNGAFRIRSELNFDYSLSDRRELALRFGVREFHNSDPDPGDDKDDFNYWLSLVLGL